MSVAPKNAYLKHEPIECLLKPPLDKTLAVQELSQAIAVTAAEALAASACSIFLIDKSDLSISQVAGTGHQEKWRGPIGRRAVPMTDVLPKPTALADKLGMTAWIASTGRPFLARTGEEFYNHAHHRGDHDSEMQLVEARKIGTFLGVPIRGSQQNVIGVIKAERYASATSDGSTTEGKIGNAFSEEDEVCLSSIALATGRCWDYLHLSLSGGHGPQDAVTAWASDVISMAASAEPDLSHFANVVARLMATVTNADSSSIFLRRGNYLMQIGGYGYQKKGNLMRSYHLPAHDTNSGKLGLTTYIAMAGEEVYLISNEALRNHKAWRGQYDVPNFKETGDSCVAFLGVPLQVGGTTLGVLKLENNRKGQRPDAADPFPDGVRRQVSVLAQAIALCVFRLRAQTSERYADIERATKLINDIMGAGGEVEDLAKHAIQGISKLVNAEACALFVLEGDRLVQYSWGACGYATKMTSHERRAYRFTPKDRIKTVPNEDSEKVGLTVWIAAMEQRFIANSNAELSAHPHHRGTYDHVNFDIGQDQRCDSFIGVPLRVDQRVIGVLKIENKKDEEGGHIAFTPADEFVVDMLASSLANALYLRSSRRANRSEFLRTLDTTTIRRPDHMWAIGLKARKAGLQGFDIEVPGLPDDAVVVRTRYLGVCGTDIQSFGGKEESPFDLVEFHEAVGEVVWVGAAVAEQRIKMGDIVVPVVRRCQGWCAPKSSSEPMSFDFRPCKEASRCADYRRPDACPQGEYPYKLDGDDVGYRSRGTGKCHGFGSEFWVDTPEWLVRVGSREDFAGERPKLKEDILDRVVLVEPLAVVWKMKREIERVRAVRPFTDRMLTLGIGPIGWLATAVMCDMYPGLATTAVDCVPTDRQWIRSLREECRTDYRQLTGNAKWHPSLTATDRFDIVVDATGSPQDVIMNAIDVLAPNGVLVLLSVVGRGVNSGANLDSNALNAIVKKNARIIGSVNESRDDFENAVSYLTALHSGITSKLDPLINTVELDPPTWNAIDMITKIKDTPRKDRPTGPKIVLKAPLR